MVQQRDVLWLRSWATPDGVTLVLPVCRPQSSCVKSSRRRASAFSRSQVRMHDYVSTFAHKKPYEDARLSSCNRQREQELHQQRQAALQRFSLCSPHVRVQTRSSQHQPQRILDDLLHRSLPVHQHSSAVLQVEMN